MNRIARVFFLIALLNFGACCIAQTTPSATPTPTPAPVNTDCLTGSIKTLQGVLNSTESRDTKRLQVIDVITRFAVHVCYLDTNATVRPQLVGRAEPKRLDKQPGASSTAAGTTSLVNKGSAPWLLGFALEHGGLTEDVDGNTITFRGNVVNSIRALLQSTYMDSFDLGDDDPLIVYLAKLSFGVSFDTTANQGSSSQGFSFNRNTFSGFTAKYELYNHRDPRDKKWRADWNQLSATAGATLASGIANLNETIRNTPGFATWRDAQADKIVAIPANAKPEDLQKALEDAINSGNATFGQDPQVQAAVSRFKSSVVPSFLADEDKIFGKIKGSTILTFDYNFVRQSLPTNPTVTTTQPQQGLPDLSNLTLVLERGFAGANTPELTFNASSTWFNSSAGGRGRVRDYRASLQLDVPLREIQQIGKPTLSFAGQYLHLLQEPLGQMVTLNGVTINRTGGVGVFQTKLSIPVKDSGVKIPISFTYANRTELIKEKDIRGNVGVTFDFDSLFSKTK